MLPLVFIIPSAYAHCTAMAINGAMKDGSNLATQSIDADGTCDYRITKVPRRKRPAGIKDSEWLRPVYADEISYPRIKDPNRSPEYAEGKDGNNALLGHIPEVDETYAYWDGYYGLQNEHQLSIGESTCSARFFTVNKLKGGSALFWVGALTKIAMERCKTARCAVQLMGDLGYEYGYWAESTANLAGEALTVADPEEAWVFHILASPCGTKAVWGAQRVPKGELAAVPNAFVIRSMNLNDSENFLASPDIVEIANQYGGIPPVDGAEKHVFTREDLDFVQAFGAGEYTHAYYSNRRIWRIYDKIAPSLKLDPNTPYTVDAPHLPFSVKPDNPLELDDLFAIYRDFYAGTAYDLTTGLASGAFGNPARYDAGPAEKSMTNGGWERAIGIYRAGYIQLSQARKDHESGVLWVGPSRPEATVFVPVMSVNLHSTAPGNLGKGNQWEVDDGLYWTVQQLANFMELKFKNMQPEVNALQKELEKEGMYLVDELSSARGPDATALVGDVLDDYVTRATQKLDQLRRQLLVKYLNGYILNPTNNGIDSPGYPETWLTGVGFDTFCDDKDDACTAQQSILAQAQEYGAELMSQSLLNMKNTTNSIAPEIPASPEDQWAEHPHLAAPAPENATYNLRRKTPEQEYFQ